MAKAKFDRTKPHVNVGTIGHVDHGKTSLTAAITKVLAKQGKSTEMAYADIAKGGVVRDASKILTVAVSHVEYETDKRHYAHIDCPGHADYIKNMCAKCLTPRKKAAHRLTSSPVWSPATSAPTGWVSSSSCSWFEPAQLPQ